MAKVKKRVLAFSRGTNQAMMRHIVLRIKSLVEVTLLTLFFSTCQDGQEGLISRGKIIV
jgi:hypothetical protein